MDVDFLSAFHGLPLRRRSELEAALSEALVRLSGGTPMTVKGVRDRFSAVNRSAKSGRIQIVGGSPEDQTVIVSVKDLATMIQAAASSLTFGEALAMTGFQPGGHEVILSEGFEPDDNLTIDMGDEEEDVAEAVVVARSS